MDKGTDILWKVYGDEKVLALLYDHGEFLTLRVRYGPEGAAIDLDLNDVAKLRESLDVWFDQHA